MVKAIAKYASQTPGRRILADVVLLAIGTLLAWSIWTGIDAREHADHSICVQLEALKRGFSDSLERGKKSIPTISYYRTHPAEKKRVLAEIDRQLRLYAPHPC